MDVEMSHICLAFLFCFFLLQFRIWCRRRSKMASQRAMQHTRPSHNVGSLLSLSLIHVHTNTYSYCLSHAFAQRPLMLLFLTLFHPRAVRGAMQSGDLEGQLRLLETLVGHPLGSCKDRLLALLRALYAQNPHVRACCSLSLFWICELILISLCMSFVDIHGSEPYLSHVHICIPCVLAYL